MFTKEQRKTQRQQQLDLAAERLAGLREKGRRQQKQQKQPSIEPVTATVAPTEDRTKRLKKQLKDARCQLRSVENTVKQLRQGQQKFEAVIAKQTNRLAEQARQLKKHASQMAQLNELTLVLAENAKLRQQLAKTQAAQETERKRYEQTFAKLQGQKAKMHAYREKYREEQKQASEQRKDVRRLHEQNAMLSRDRKEYRELAEQRRETIASLTEEVAQVPALTALVERPDDTHLTTFATDLKPKDSAQYLNSLMAFNDALNRYMGYSVQTFDTQLAVVIQFEGVAHMSLAMLDEASGEQRLGDYFEQGDVAQEPEQEIVAEFHTDTQVQVGDVVKVLRRISENGTPDYKVIRHYKDDEVPVRSRSQVKRYRTKRVNPLSDAELAQIAEYRAILTNKRIGIVSFHNKAHLRARLHRYGAKTTLISPAEASPEQIGAFVHSESYDYVFVNTGEINHSVMYHSPDLGKRQLAHTRVYYQVPVKQLIADLVHYFRKEFEENAYESTPV